MAEADNRFLAEPSRDFANSGVIFDGIIWRLADNDKFRVIGV
jgi:hypothetical protein